MILVKFLATRRDLVTHTSTCDKRIILKLEKIGCFNVQYERDSKSRHFYVAISARGNAGNWRSLEGPAIREAVSEVPMAADIKISATDATNRIQIVSLKFHRSVLDRFR